MDGSWGQWVSEGEDFLRADGALKEVEAACDQLPWVQHFAPGCSGEQSNMQMSVDVSEWYQVLSNSWYYVCLQSAFPPWPPNTALKIKLCWPRLLGFLPHFGVCSARETKVAERHCRRKPSLVSAWITPCHLPGYYFHGPGSPGWGHWSPLGALKSSSWVFT